MPPDDLGQILGRSSYSELFQQMRSKRRAAILAAPDAPEGLRRHLHDATAAPACRLLAAELLHHVDPRFLDTADARELAAIYAGALAVAGDGGAWGMPGLWDEPPTTHLIHLGRVALPALAPLLSSERRVHYTGSKRATLAELYHLRVKDLAGHVVARILGARFALDESPVARDAAIRGLATRIEAEGP